MNISSNNLRGFSQYSLLNKLFSQKNGNLIEHGDRDLLRWYPNL